MTQELVILVGLPASGKTYYAKTMLPGHVHVSKDTMPRSTRSRNRQARQMRAIGEALFAGRSVVVDNCNAYATERAPIVALGKTRRVHVQAMLFAPDLKLSVERNMKRVGDALVPEFVIRKMAREIERPTLDEGFDEILGSWAP